MFMRSSANRARRGIAATIIFLTLAIPVANAKDDEQVSVYTSREREFIEPLLRVFEQLTRIKLNLVYVKDDLVQRLAAEGENTRADLILASEFSQLAAAKERDLTQPVDIPSLVQRIPAAYRDAEGHWFGLSHRARVVFVSRERVKQDSFTYEDLADLKWKGRVCMRSGRHPYNVGLVASLIVHKGEAWTELWLRGLKANLNARPSGGDRDQIANVHAGKCDIAVANTYYFGAMLAKDSRSEQKTAAAAVKPIFPNTADRGTHVSISGMALTRHARNPDNATLLMDFLVSEPAQFIYAMDNHEYPVHADVAPSAMVAGWGRLKPDSVSLATLAQVAKKAAALIDKVGFDLGPGT